MIPETALRLAGPGSHLAARPRGVVHVVPAGPLTPSGRFIPRSSRTVCRARHRRLTVVEPRPSLDAGQPGRRLCALCSARLAGVAPGAQDSTYSKQAGRAPQTRGYYLRRHADVTALDLALAAVTATTTSEIDQVGHLSLLLLGHAGCQQPVTTPDGRPLPGEPADTTVHQLIAKHRARLTPVGEHEQKVAAYDRENADLAAATRRANRHEIRAARDERIRQLGITNAYPTR